MGSESLALGVLWYAVFIFSLTCHEAAHAWAAKKLGDDTAYLGGQVTLNPIPHIQRSPVGTIVVPLLTFFLSNFQWMMGWASAPFDPFWQQRHPRRAAKMALAGPLANLALVIAAAIVIKLGIAAGAFRPPDSANFTSIVAQADGGSSAVTMFLSIMVALNLLLFVFNLIPVPPLDGYSVIGLFVSEGAAHRLIDFAQNPAFSLFGIIIAWNVIKLIFWPSFLIFLNILYPGMY